jgi:hypothetical protein
MKGKMIEERKAESRVRPTPGAPSLFIIDVNSHLG